MTDLKGKKLLFLGCSAHMAAIVSHAKTLGIYTIATDFNLNYDLSPAKKVADEAWDISWSDLDTLEARCRAEHIDGVFTGFSEFTVIQARKLCDRLGLPFYATAEQIELTRDKKKFKNLCKEYGIPVVSAYELEEGEDIPASIQYPVIVKPTDNGGSKGISVCRTKEELIQGIEKALAFSASGNYIVEQFMEGTEVTISYTIKNGVMSLTCLSDAIAGEAQEGLVGFTNGWAFPSKHLALYKEKLDAKVRGMFEDIGVMNGFMFLSAFCQDDNFYFFEMGFRLGGGSTYRFTSAVNGVNPAEMMLYHALTGEMEGPDLTVWNRPAFDRNCCSLCIMLQPGRIAKIEGLDRIQAMPGVLDIDQTHNQGDVIERTGSLTQCLGRISLIADDPDAFADLVETIYSELLVLNENGEDMILNRLDTEMLRHYWED